MTTTENSLNWFEIPVADIARAKTFYETIFGIKMPEQEMMGLKMALFPGDSKEGKVSGALVQGPAHKPSADGTKVYLNGNPDLAVALARVEKAGGKVLMPKTMVNESVGFMSFFKDSEENTVALHSIK